MAFCKTLGLIGIASPVLRLRALSHAKAHGAGDTGNSGRALPARQCWTIRVSQDLAGYSAGDWSGQIGAEQCFVRGAHRAAASGHAARCSTRLAEFFAAAGGAAES